jgi:tetratricopeptide (TPR) repeat protein
MRSFLLYLLMCSNTLLFAQDKLSAKKHVKMAEQLLAENRLAAAAMHYEAAWSQKPKKLDYLNEAAELYLEARDYRKAAEAFSKIKDNKSFPEARLYYAQALQQNGQYDEAIPEFLLYLNSYEGKDREQLKDRIEEAILGCTKAIVQTDSTISKKISIEHLSENINSPDDDIAPVPFGDDILYFTNSVFGKAKILRSQQLNNSLAKEGQTNWSLAQVVENLPILPDASYGNGAFSPDGLRFYFAKNETVVVKKEQKTVSTLYLLIRTDKDWSAPKKLSNNVNTEGGQTTSPFVFHKNGKEYLYFSSDRQGGQGDMDIWYCTRDLKSEDFSPAQNMGSIINTEGDDVTPYFDVEENVLYFSSNGRATFGGMDIFKSKGFENRWLTPENMGLPFNSPADDWYFIKNKSRTGGFFTSNRSVGAEKLTTRDDDIYLFKINTQQELAISGVVYEKDSKTFLDAVRVSLYERRGYDNQRLLSSLMCANGHFNFPILPNKTYILEVEKDLYRLSSFDFNTLELSKNINKDFSLERYKVLASTHEEKPKPSSKPSKYVENTTATNEKTNKKPSNIIPQSRDDDKNGKGSVTAVPKKENTPPRTQVEATKNNKPTKTSTEITYKVQVTAYENLDNTTLRRLARVDDLGDFDMEKVYIDGVNFTRVMLSSYASYDEAAIILKKVKDRSLSDAFIIRYESGKRTNKSR